MDDLNGRRTAEPYRIETTTTLGLILELLVEGARGKTDYERDVKEHGSQGSISDEIIQEFIEKGRGS